MTDNLLLYLNQKLNSGLICSGDNIDFLLWGMRDNSDAKLLGISLNMLDSIESSKKAENFETIGHILAKSMGLKFIVIKYPWDLIANPDAIMQIDGESYKQKEAGAVLQKIWGTSLSQIGTKKEVNKHVADVFHAWARENLPTSYIRFDIDAFHINDGSPFEILSLIEIKRSTAIKVDNWNPFTADIRNYLLQHKLANLVGIEFYTLNHGCKDILVEDKTIIGLHIIKNVNLDSNVINSEKKLLSASELATFLSTKKK